MGTDEVPRVAYPGLDERYRSLNRLYLNRNFHRDAFSIFGHLVEIIGGLSGVASGKKKQDVTPQNFVPKAIAWWLALCGKVGVRSVEQMLWWKYPSVCPYCELREHRNAKCRQVKL